MHRFSAFIGAIFFSVFGYTLAAEPAERIAVAAQGTEPTAEISQLASRAPHFLIFDETGTLLEVLPNRFKDTERKAGPLAVGLLAEHRVTVLVAGLVGPQMHHALLEHHIRFVQGAGVAQDMAKRAAQ